MSKQTAREQWIRENAIWSDLAAGATLHAQRVVEVSNKVDLETIGRQLRDTLSNEALGALVLGALASDNADETIQEAVIEVQTEAGRRLGESDCKQGLEQGCWERISACVFANRILPPDDFSHVADGYREGYDNAVEWRPLNGRELASNPPFEWQIKPAPGGGFLYRPRRDGWAVPWSLVEQG